MTTRAVAARAGVPIATIYQFFANRDALLEELVLRDIERLDEEVADKLGQVKARTLPEAVERIIEIHRDHYRRDPELVALYYAGRERGRFQEVGQHRERFARLVHALLLERGLLRSDTDLLVIQIAIELGARIAELAHRGAADGDPKIMAEGKLVLIRYLQAYASGA